MQKKLFQKISRFLLQILNFIFGSILVALTAIAIFKPALIEQFIGWMEKQIHVLGSWNYLIAFASSIIESFPVVGVLVPGQQVMLLVGGFFGKLGQIQLGYMIVFAIIGALIGNAIGYFLGKWYGHEFLERYGDWFGLGRTELKYLKKQIEKNGAWFIILGKFHNFTRAFIPFIAGSMGMHTGKFWIYNIIGSVLWAGTIITLGVAFVTYYKTILSYFSYILMGIMICSIMYIYFFKREAFMIYIKEKEKEIEDKAREAKEKINEK
jgi:membrane protein DedA with SNARE-associated domain